VHAQGRCAAGGDGAAGAGGVREHGQGRRRAGHGVDVSHGAGNAPAPRPPALSARTLREDCTMAGYSRTPLASKLGIKPGHRVALVDAPPGFAQTLGELPEGVTLHTGLPGNEPFDVIVFFTDSRARLRLHFAAQAARLTPAGGFWVAWPKKASG